MLLKSTKLLLIISSLILSSCATTQRGKIFEYGLIGGLVGGIYGAQRSEFQNENAAMFSSIGALSGVAIASMMDDRDDQIKDLTAKVKFFDESLLSKNNKSMTDSIDDLPEEYRPLLESQNYEIYRINRWTRKGPRYLVKESEVIQLNGSK